MLTIGVSMMKNEIDLAVDIAQHMLEQVDQVWIMDNGSTDGTGKALRNIRSKRLIILDDPIQAYYQSAKMTRLANMAWQASSYQDCWIVPFDGDEWWESADDCLTVADVLNGQSERGFRLVSAKLYDYRCTSRDIESAGSPIDRMVWRTRQPAPLPKVAVRWSEDCLIQQGNHGAIVPGNPEFMPADLIIRHYPWRSAEHMARKAAQGKKAYDMTDLPDDLGQHWREYGAHYERGGLAAIKTIFDTWFYSDDPASDDLVLDPARP